MELFFKWLKQHLRIKKFWGTDENAVRIQIYSAICAYCLVAIVQHNMQLKRSTYEVLQILGVSLTDKTPLFDLFNNNQLNDFKELNDSNGQLLLNFQNVKFLVDTNDIISFYGSLMLTAKPPQGAIFSFRVVLEVTFFLVMV